MVATERETVKRTLRLSDDVYEWATAEARARGLTIGAFVEATLEAARTQQATGVVQQQAAGALEQAIQAGIGSGFVTLVQQLGAVFDLLTLEAVRARMTGEEHLAYMYDSSDLECPHCGKPYVQAQPGPAFAAQRSQVIMQKARAALAAGGVPRIRPW
jgi:hypothetical protein